VWSSGVWASGFWANGFWVDSSGNASNFWASNFWADGFWADGFWSGLEKPVVPPVVPPVVEAPSGGWAVAFAREQRRLKEEDERRERERLEAEAEEKAALAREIAELETHLVDEGRIEKVSRETDLIRLRDLAASFDALPNRAQRALDYAERAKTEAALILAQREMQRLAEEEEMAVVLMLAMMD
jgi:hypothetical protein